MTALATFVQQVINGLMLGGGYALVAIGYTLIFGVLNLLHLAHGEVAMIGSYVGLTLVIIAMSQVGVLPLWLVLLVAMLGAGIVGIIVELVAFRPLGRRQLHITPLITTIAVAFVLQEAAVKLFGSEQRSFPVAMFDGFKRYDLQLGAFRITYVQMFIIAASLSPSHECPCRAPNLTRPPNAGRAVFRKSSSRCTALLRKYSSASPAQMCSFPRSFGPSVPQSLSRTFRRSYFSHSRATSRSITPVSPSHSGRGRPSRCRPT